MKPMELIESIELEKIFTQYDKDVPHKIIFLNREVEESLQVPQSFAGYQEAYLWHFSQIFLYTGLEIN